MFSIRLPLPIETSLKLVGATTTPISMIVVGSMLAEMKFKNIFSDLSIYYATIVRLLIVPMIVYVVLKLIKVDELLLNICVILQAMPAAVSTAIIAEKYGGDNFARLAVRIYNYNSFWNNYTYNNIIFIEYG